jgi:superfamily II DNA or RNA helicase
MSKLQPQYSPPSIVNKISNVRQYKNVDDFNNQRVNKNYVTDNKTIGSDIILSETQKIWFDKVLKILEDNRLYIDTSEMGSGKTFIVLMLAIVLKLPLFVVCPASVEGVWITECKNYNILLIDVIGYQSLRSIKGKQPKHGYLTRTDFQVSGNRSDRESDSDSDREPEDIMYDVKFTVTKTFKELVKKGMLLIFDEFQMIKNNTAQFKACYGLINGLDTIESESRIGLLSATPIDKAKQSINLFYMLGFISGYDPVEHVDELLENCSNINPELTEEISKKYDHQDYDSVSDMYFSLYEKLIKKQISGYIEPTRQQYTVKGEQILKEIKDLRSDSSAGSSTGAPAVATKIKNLEKELKKEVLINDIKNGYYNLSDAGYQKLYAAVDKFNKLKMFFKDIPGRKPIAKGNLTKILKEIEIAKIEIFCRIGLQTLEDPSLKGKSKIIFCVNYTATIIALKEFFKKYDPLILVGSIEKKNRPDIIATFNNDPKRRVLLCNIEVGGVGISLHDKNGQYPRFMFISPGYKMLSIHQATGRIYRKGVRSNATTRLVYGNLNGMIEEKIINALNRKSAILRKAIRNKDVLLPDQYPDYYEPDTADLNRFQRQNLSDVGSDVDSDADSEGADLENSDGMIEDGEEGYLSAVDGDFE